MNKQRFETLYAGPGCGKTTILLDRYKQDSTRAALVTFSRKTAQELRDRTGSKDARTFHSMAYDIAKKLYPNFVITPYRTSSSSGLTFDDIMHIAVDECYLIANQYDTIYIDEFQDLDHTQLRLVEALIREGVSIVAVGDPNQSIYGFRNNNSNPFEAARHFGATLEIGSTDSYRLPLHVASASNNLIRHNNPPVGFSVSSVSNDQTSIQVWLTKDDNRKAEKVKKKLDKLQGSAMILFRTNAEAEYFLNLPPFEDMTIRREFTTAAQEAQNAAAILLQLYEAGVSDPLILKKFISPTTHSSDIERLCDVIFSSVKEVAILSEVLAMTGNFYISEVLDQFSEMSITQAIQAIDDLPYKYDATLANGCRVMTIHGSKGLEADCVFVDMNDAHLPLSRTNIEEERRLAYVALTRTKKELVVMCSESYMESTLLPIVTKPSIFLYESRILKDQQSTHTKT